MSLERDPGHMRFWTNCLVCDLCNKPALSPEGGLACPSLVVKPLVCVGDEDHFLCGDCVKGSTVCPVCTSSPAPLREMPKLRTLIAEHSASVNLCVVCPGKCGKSGKILDMAKHASGECLLARLECQACQGRVYAPEMEAHLLACDKAQLLHAKDSQKEVGLHYNVARPFTSLAARSVYQALFASQLRHAPEPIVVQMVVHNVSGDGSRRVEARVSSPHYFLRCTLYAGDEGERFLHFPLTHEEREITLAPHLADVLGRELTLPDCSLGYCLVARLPAQENVDEDALAAERGQRATEHRSALKGLFNGKLAGLRRPALDAAERQQSSSAEAAPAGAPRPSPNATAGRFGAAGKVARKVPRARPHTPGRTSSSESEGADSPQDALMVSLFGAEDPADSALDARSGSPSPERSRPLEKKTPPPPSKRATASPSSGSSSSSDDASPSPPRKRRSTSKQDPAGGRGSGAGGSGGVGGGGTSGGGGGSSASSGKRSGSSSGKKEGARGRASKRVKKEGGKKENVGTRKNGQQLKTPPSTPASGSKGKGAEEKPPPLSDNPLLYPFKPTDVSRPTAVERAARQPSPSASSSSSPGRSDKKEAPSGKLPFASEAAKQMMARKASADQQKAASTRAVDRILEGWQAQQQQQEQQHQNTNKRLMDLANVSAAQLTLNQMLGK